MTRGTRQRDFRRLLAEQISCMEQMHKVLEQESTALVSGDFDGLNAAGASKQRIANALEALELDRRSMAEAEDDGQDASMTGILAALDCDFNRSTQHIG